MNANKCFLILAWLGLSMPFYAVAATPNTHHSAKKVHTVSHKKKHQKIHASKNIHSTPQKAKSSTLRSALPQQGLAAALIPPLSSNLHAQIRTEEVPSEKNSFTRRLTQFAYETVHTFRYSAYKFGGSYFDLAHGIYILDCSSYVDSILRKSYPGAYRNLTNATGADRPTTSHYYDFFNNLSNRSKQYWRKIDQVGQLRPGDIIVFRTKSPAGNESGHVMIVMDKPVQTHNTYQVRIADSAPSRHSEDTRSAHQSGIGIGTFLLKADPNTYEPLAYAWSVGARFKRNVNFAMARPVALD